MKYIADLHIHSPFSRATSKQLVPENIDYWAKIKGLNVIGTGDFTHPDWLAQLKEKLEPAEPGLYRLKKAYQQKNLDIVKDTEVRFILTSEISSIYKKNDRVRKVHNLICVPNFETVDKINARLNSMKLNLKSDGRPIVGVDSKLLLEIMLEANRDTLFIPAHIWTPWFSALGSKSGFDSIDECFDELTKYIYAVETGLSADIPMNRICSILDKFALVSNSDAHSPEKLGRNANIFNTELSYFAMCDALKANNGKTFIGTIDLFPQEGKYHYDGHRKCDLCWSPLETIEHNGICPVCGKGVVVGVLNRVAQLSDGLEYDPDKFAATFYSIITLKDILSEIAGVGPASKKVNALYFDYISQYGAELSLLLNLPLEQLEADGHNVLAEALYRMRGRRVRIAEGYDGEYGEIKAFSEDELTELKMFNSLLGSNLTGLRDSKAVRKLIPFDLEKFQKLKKANPDFYDGKTGSAKKIISKKRSAGNLDLLNKEQQSAVLHKEGPALIIAGPGTGKTRTLAARVVYLVKEKKINACNILAITFTNKAAREMQERVQSIFTNKAKAADVNIFTFHGLGYYIIKRFADKLKIDKDFIMIDNDKRKKILNDIFKFKQNKLKELDFKFTEIKQNLKEITDTDIEEKDIQDIFKIYTDYLVKNNLLEIDDLIYRFYFLLKEDQEVREYCHKEYHYLFVDEYQDVNYAQYMLVRELMPDQKSNLMVIGDPDQAIYGFRGANRAFIEKFANDYREARLYQLKQSYRCSKIILKASGNILTKEKTSFLKGMSQGVEIKISEHRSGSAEAEFIARAVQQLMGGVSFFSLDSNVSSGDEGVEISLSEIAILCRVKAQMPAIETALQNHAIPYQLIGNDSLLEIKLVRELVDLMEIIVLNKEEDYFKKQLKNYSQDIILAIKSTASKKSVKCLAKFIAEKIYTNLTVEENFQLERFYAFASNYKKDYIVFFKDFKLSSGQDLYDNQIERVTVMTMHAAKGLEFDTVFVPGCEEKIIPYALYETHQADFEEEKRLLYVAMTRAKRNLFLSYADKRIMRGQKFILAKSHFLDVIEKELVDFHKPVYKVKGVVKEDSTDQLELF